MTRHALTLSLALAVCAVPAQTPPLPAVFGENRPAGADVLILRPIDEDSEAQRLVGDLLTGPVVFQAPYVRLDLPAARIAGVAIGDPEDEEAPLDTLVTVNGDQFSGLLLTPAFAFRVQGGGEINVRRELIQSLIRRADPAEAHGIPVRQQFRLHGGDHFSGSLLAGESITIVGAYGPVSLPLAELQTIRAPEEGGPIHAHAADGTVLAGALDPPRLTIELDCTAGFPVPPAPFSLHAGRISLLQCQPGPPTDVMLTAGPPPDLALPNATELPVGGERHDADLDQSQIDEYWFAAVQGRSYTITTENLSAADTVMELLAPDGTTQIQRDDDGGINMGSRILWTCGETAIHYLRVHQYGGGPQFLAQFPGGVLPQGYPRNFPRGNYAIWVEETAAAPASPVSGARP